MQKQLRKRAIGMVNYKIIPGFRKNTAHICCGRAVGSLGNSTKRQKTWESSRLNAIRG